jgi:hypothetical protein
MPLFSPFRGHKLDGGNIDRLCGPDQESHQLAGAPLGVLTEALQLRAILPREPHTYYFWEVHLSWHCMSFLGFEQKRRPAQRLA